MKNSTFWQAVRPEAQARIQAEINALILASITEKENSDETN